MVETRRSSVSSSSSKRSLSHPSPCSKRKRSKDEQDRSKSEEPAPVSADPAAGAEKRVEEDTGLPTASEERAPPEAEQPEKNSAAAAAAAKPSSEPQPKVTWAKLLSQCSQNPHVNIVGPIFTIGQSEKCSLILKGTSVSPTLCKVKRTEHGGAFVATLEILGSKGVVLVNGKTLQRNSKFILSGGDEVVFNSPGKYAYIFQKLVNDKLKIPVKPVTLGLPDAHDALVKGIQIGTRSGDSSAFTGASILASLSNPRKDPPAYPSPASNAREVQQGLERSISSSACDIAGCIPDTVSNCHAGEDTSENDGTRIRSGDKAAAPAADIPSNDSFRLNWNAQLDAELGKISVRNHELKRMLAGTASELALSGGNIFKVFEDQREVHKEFDSSAAFPATRCDTFRDDLKRGVLNASDIEVSFENFPYYLSENTKNVLLSCAYVHLECKEFVKYTAEISSMNHKILLSGPTGSEIYQEVLTKALAKHFGARLLIIDSLVLPGAPSSKDSEPGKDAGKSEKSGIFSKHRAALADSSQHKRPVSSVEADILGASTFNCPSLPKQEASTASSKSYTFKEGDRVRYVGSLHSPGCPLQTPHRGPNFGYRGKVLLSFEENVSSKIGVRFDRQFLKVMT
ncbi:uncharacterized protein M6B38_275250 [Iris pallida]|uniref:FHA domain-containing protein n=1 Tax=Iris pallida TaxID=29817 RepID=A0AAX6I6P8_IRIPA|nr:uncharacterized protein M6B38_275250 [Iris pallida]